MRRIGPAFTLLETIVSVALVSVLLTLILPSLGQIRDAAADQASLSNMRSHAQILGAYAGDWDDYFPAFADPRATFSVVRGCNEVQVIRYFEAVVWWPMALCESYYADELGSDAFMHPRAVDDESRPFRASYFLSSSFLASPKYWNATSRTDSSQWGPNRLGDASFPSQKAIVTEYHPFFGLPTVATTHAVGLAYSDGSAARSQTSDLLVPYPRGEGTGPGTWLPIGVYGMHTNNGILGRDRP